MSEDTLAAKLLRVQAKLKAPKGQFNDFGKYHYRSCEDILEALKPLLAEEGLLLTLTDSVVEVGQRYYVRALAQVVISGSSDGRVAEAYAREDETKKGMDGAQITGAASSYARKYALNGLFLIDDTRDSDAQAPVEEPAAKAEGASPNKSVFITVAQRNRLWAITKTKRSADEDARALIEEAMQVELGSVVSSKEIPKDKYEAVCAYVEAAAAQKTEADEEPLPF